MKKNKSLVTILVLLVLIVACAGGYFAIQHANSAAEAEDSTIYLTDFSGDDIASIRYVWQGNEVNVTYDAATTTWQLVDAPDKALKTARLNAMKTALDHMIAERCFDNPGNLSDYGLQSPETTLTVTLTDGSSLQLQFGSKNTNTGNIYVLKQGDDHIYTIASSLYTVYNYTEDDLISEA